MTLVTCLKIMRGKNNVPAASVLPVFLKLFKCKDKALRKYLHGIIISDIKQELRRVSALKINYSTRKGIKE